MNAEAATATVESPENQRFSLKPEGSARGSVDGAWWPETHDLATELPTIARSVGRRLTRLERVGYHLVDWDAPAAGKTTCNGDTVRLEGFGAWTPGIVRFMGPGGTLSVTLIGADTDPETARAVMARAASPDNIESSATLAGSHADAGPAPAPTPR
ncbi:DUF5994 family protein [Gordonia terrae]|uniref:CobW C-terminal domain-containing protein n=1 Tax=Gordonia terrae NBRC 100016 TaxID=1089454 RepID=A0ABQ0HAC2_9ACTN|nr:MULTISPECIES: DUF5994 family protein [Gordonia]ANY23177.1 hypothetical protein BCM27_10555 [Gordonia terrae]GAB42839.1 hypothetical protein GOTRE_026_00910 [Gordonia terrae NBRC 100016]VTR10090.1 Uncharacterised protein [Clostridioides difficile]VTS49054.1 Uncharacterised protein [Gordonia terrae]